MSVSNIDINLSGIGNLIKSHLLRVPPYQRSYAWTKEEVVELLQDLTSACDSGAEYFLGSIVLTRDPQVAGLYEVIDGQQRLASVSILLAAIRDHFQSGGDKRATNLENSYLLVEDLDTLETSPRLQLNSQDNEHFSRKIAGSASLDQLPLEQKPSPPSIVRLTEAAKVCQEHISKQTSTRADKGLSWLLTLIKYIDESTRVIVVKVPDHANAFTIFETLNDRGLDLSVADLLKNRLFNLAGNSLPDALERWTRMSQNLALLNDDRSIVTFIRHYWSSVHGPTREKQLYAEMKQKITGKAQAVKLCEQLFTNSSLYIGIANPELEELTQFGPTVRERLQTLRTLGMEQVRPMLLAAFDTQLESNTLRDILKLLVSFSVRFLIVGGLGGGTMERKYAEAAVALRAGKLKSGAAVREYFTDVVPKDDVFQTSFEFARVSKPQLARYYLMTLERQFASQDLVPSQNTEIVNLEHVVPKASIRKGKGWDGLDSETCESLLHLIGNLALMNSKQNSEDGLEEFSKKRSSYIKSRFELTKIIAENNVWGPLEIQTRQKRIAELAVQEWTLSLSK